MGESPFRLTQYGTEEALELLLEEAELDAPNGRVADYIPDLRLANADDQGISICYTDGSLVSAGRFDQPFTIQSTSKTIALLYALEQLGPKQVFGRVGKEPTGEPFNSGLRFQAGTKRPLNPMINAGAIVVSSLFPGRDPDERFAGFLDFVRKVCVNADLQLNEKVYLSEKATGHNNRSLAWIMNDRKVFSYKHDLTPGEFVEGILDVYFRQCSIEVTTADLARFGALLANLGIDPETGKRFAAEEHVIMVLALMESCGLYDGSGVFAAKIGIPGKSGVGGGILCAIPAKLGIATYGPGLDSAGNSTFGLYALEKIAAEENLSIFAQRRRPAALETYKDSKALDELAQRAGLEVTLGRVATYIPELAQVLPEHRGVSICTLDDGEVIGGGQHSDFTFTLQSVCIPFLLSYALHRRGTEFVFSKVGREPTGDHFDADPKWITIDGKPWPFNPMINSGAILITSMLPEETCTARRESFLEFVRKVCRNPGIDVDQAVYESERAFGERNRKLAWELLHTGCFRHRVRPTDQSKVEYVEEILADYFYACSLMVSCDDLACFAALLAAQGNTPEVAGMIRISPEHISEVVTLMTACGLYDGSGEYAFAVGLPSKSGVSGALMAVAPGKLGIGAFCSAVDPKGASVVGRYLIEEIARTEQLSIFQSG